MEFTSTALFDPNTPINYWEGIVVKREEWPRTKTPVSDAKKELNNWGYRVKVRIQGIHPEDKNILPDSKLPWIELPVDSFGSGHRATGSTPGITQGTIVWGIWGSPSIRKHPHIIGIKANNDQTDLLKEQIGGFDPLSGFSYTDVVPGFATPLFEGNPLEGVAFGNVWNVSDAFKYENEFTFSIDSPSDCKSTPLQGIQLAIKNLIQKIEKVKKQLTIWKNAAQGWIQEKQEYINNLIRGTAKTIAESIRWLYEKIRKYVMEYVHDRTKRIYGLVNPPERDKVRTVKDTIIELITCLFNKLTSKLFNMVLGLLTQALGKFVNVPSCVVEKIISFILGNLTGFLTGAIDKILGILSSVVGGAFSIADKILGFIQKILGFFSCDNTQDCPEVVEWNLWSGAKPKVEFDIDSIFNEAKQIGSEIGDSFNTEDFSIDFTKLMDGFKNSINGCYTGPQFCGPPRVEIFGGGGSGAKANAIVSATGQILGVDVISSGFGYTKAPFVKIVDDCGKGKGAVVKAIIGGGLLFSPVSNNTTKSGGAATFSIRLQTRPETDVLVNLIISDPTQAILSESVINFTINNWNIPQVITITGKNDFIPGDVNYTINGESVSKDKNYNAKTGVVYLTNIDNYNLTGDEIDNVLINPNEIAADLLIPDRTISGDCVVQIIVEEPGFGYISSPDGDLGGDGRIWATKDEIIVIRNDGTYDDPYDANAEIPTLNEGDTLIEPSDRITANVDGTMIVKGFPTVSDGSYPALLYLCNIQVVRSGINYSKDDVITIEPDDGGAILEPVFGPFGVLENVNIISTGIGFTERPLIYIKSKTGYNAEINPVFCVNRIGDDTEGVGKVPPNIQGQVISVVDCVGKV
jgi:hypothetical protein